MPAFIRKFSLGFLTAPFLAVAAFTGLPATAQADNITADLKAYNVNRGNLPIARDSVGDAKLKVRQNRGTVEYTVNFEGIDSGVIMAHIHFGNAWQNGPITVWLCETAPPFQGPIPSPQCPQGSSGTISGTFSAAEVLEAGSPDSGITAGDLEALLAAMNNSSAYVLIHSNEFIPGEIRGQAEGRVNLR